MKLLKLTLLSIFLYSGISFAGGFQLNDHSARSIGLGFSTVANLNNASANYYNPACLVNAEEDLGFSIGASYIMPGGKFTGFTNMNQQNTTSLETWNFLIPNFYANWKTPISGLNLGLGVFVPFGLGTRWPSDWVGRFSTVETYLENVEINPNLAYSFKIANIPMAISAGFGYVMSDVELNRNLSTFSPEPKLKLKGNSTGTTFNFGFYAELVKDLKIGAAYRHNIKIDYDGEVSYQNITGLEALFVPSTGKTKLNYPNDFRFGIAYNFTKDLCVELSMNYVGWSSYDTLTINFDKRPGMPSVTYESKAPRLYKDVIAYKLGAEYKASENLFIRCGTGYDPMPIEAKDVEPILPEGNRIIGSLGFGYNINKNYSFDIAYCGIYALQTETKDNPNGIDGLYNSWANILSLSFNIKF